MIKEVIQSLDFLLLAELALLLFAGVFVAVLVRTLRTDKKTVQQHAAIVLHDDARGGDR